MEARTGNTPAAEARVPIAERVREIVVRYGVIAITVILIVFFVASEDTFRKSTTLLSVLKYASVIAIGGLGVTTAMVVGGIDLSIGGVAGMAVTISAMTMVIYDQVGFVAIALVLISGALVGLVNAFLIVRLRIPDMLATLSVMFVVQGAKGGGTLHAEHLAKAVEEKSFEQCENHLDLLVRVTAPALWVRVGPGPAPRSA